MVVIYALATIAGWVYILRWRTRKQQAGKLLLVLGRPDGRMLGNFVGGFGVTAPLIIVFALGLFPITIPVLIWAAAFLTVAIYWFLSGWSKLQLCENGILDFTGVLKWKDVAACNWEGRYGNVLVIQVSRPPEWLQSVPFLQSLLSKTIYLFWASRIVVYLSPSAKDAANSILSQFIAADRATVTTKLPDETI